MPRPRTSLNTSGSIALTPQVREDGKWVTAGTGRKPERWKARTKHRDADGVLRDVTRFAPTKAKAETLLKQALVDRAAPAKAAEMRPDMSVVNAGRFWLAQVERSELAASTKKQYAENFKRYIVGSSIQGLSLREVNSVGTVERFLQGVADQNGEGAARMARKILSGILGLAVRYGVLPHNATKDVKPAKALVRKVSKHDTDRALTREERALVLKVSEEHPQEASQDVADLMHFLAGTGVRLQEALACTWWSDVSLSVRGSGEGASSTVHVRGTKTDKADRILSLPPWLADRLRERGVRRGTEGLVFGSPRISDKTKPRDRRNITRAIGARFEEAGLPWATSHTFRRTVATWMDEAGAPLAEIANQLGHANVSVTASYLGRRGGSSRAADVL